MAARTLTEIKEKLAALDIQISEAEKRQASTSGGPGQGQHTQRGDLAAMYRERERLENKYEEMEGQTSGNSKNLTRFGRPR